MRGKGTSVRGVKAVEVRDLKLTVEVRDLSEFEAELVCSLLVYEA